MLFLGRKFLKQEQSDRLEMLEFASARVTAGLLFAKLLLYESLSFYHPTQTLFPCFPVSLFPFFPVSYILPSHPKSSNWTERLIYIVILSLSSTETT